MLLFPLSLLILFLFSPFLTQSLFFISYQAHSHSISTFRQLLPRQYFFGSWNWTEKSRSSHESAYLPECVTQR